MHRLIRQSMSSGLLAFLLCGCARNEPYADEVVVIQPVQFYDIGQVDTAPKILSQVSPVYPFELRRNGYEGEALIGVFVSADGSVSASVIWRATDIRFGECARQALLKWRYKPAEMNHHPVACALAVRMKFTFLPDESTQITTSDGLSLDEIKRDLANHPLEATPVERPSAQPTPSPGAPQR
jgi:TonB family protein